MNALKLNVYANCEDCGQDILDRKECHAINNGNIILCGTCFEEHLLSQTFICDWCGERWLDDEKKTIGNPDDPNCESICPECEEA